MILSTESGSMFLCMWFTKYLASCIFNQDRDCSDFGLKVQGGIFRILIFLMDGLNNLFVVGL